MRGVAWSTLLMAMACTAPNPAYEDSGALGSESGQSNDTGTSGPESEEGSSSGEAACELHPERPFELLAFDEQGRIEPPPCSPMLQVLPLPSGSSTFEGNTITHVECLDTDTDCLCTGQTFEIEVDIGGQPVFDAGVPSCGPIYLWSAPGTSDPEACEWGGLMMQREAEGTVMLAPAFIAARTLAVPPLGPMFMLDLQLEPEGGCVGECLRHPPGRHQLDVLGELVMVDGQSHFVEASFLEGFPIIYKVRNHMASVTRDCETQLAWTAVVN